MPLRTLRNLTLALLLLAAWGRLGAQALAEGFTRLPEGAKIVAMPLDVELFALTAGGVAEPKAEWTEKGRNNLAGALAARAAEGHATLRVLSEAEAEPFSELRHLHGAVASAILIHHFGSLKLPGKGGRLDWSLGEDAAAVGTAADADYALFLFLQDSYSTGGRVAAITFMALLGVAAPGGTQLGYASLVDLATGRVLWFNRIARAAGDVREPEPARKTLDLLLSGFPG